MMFVDVFLVKALLYSNNFRGRQKAPRVGSNPRVTSAVVSRACGVRPLGHRRGCGSGWLQADLKFKSALFMGRDESKALSQRLSYSKFVWVANLRNVILFLPRSIG